MTWPAVSSGMNITESLGRTIKLKLQSLTGMDKTRAEFRPMNAQRSLQVLEVAQSLPIGYILRVHTSILS